MMKLEEKEKTFKKFVEAQRKLPLCKGKAVNVFITNYKNDIDRYFSRMDEEIPSDSTLRWKLGFTDRETHGKV